MTTTTDLTAHLPPEVQKLTEIREPEGYVFYPLLDLRAQTLRYRVEFTPKIIFLHNGDAVLGNRGFSRDAEIAFEFAEFAAYRPWGIDEKLLIATPDGGVYFFQYIDGSGWWRLVPSDEPIPSYSWVTGIVGVILVSALAYFCILGALFLLSKLF